MNCSKTKHLYIFGDASSYQDFVITLDNSDHTIWQYMQHKGSYGQSAIVPYSFLLLTWPGQVGFPFKTSAGSSCSSPHRPLQCLSSSLSSEDWNTATHSRQVFSCVPSDPWHWSRMFASPPYLKSYIKFCSAPHYLLKHHSTWLDLTWLSFYTQRNHALQLHNYWHPGELLLAIWQSDSLAIFKLQINALKNPKNKIFLVHIVLHSCCPLTLF